MTWEFLVVVLAVVAVPGSFQTATAPIAAIGIDMTANNAITATKYQRVLLSSLSGVVVIVMSLCGSRTHR